MNLTVGEFELVVEACVQSCDEVNSKQKKHCFAWGQPNSRAIPGQGHTHNYTNTHKNQKHHTCVAKLVLLVNLLKKIPTPDIKPLMSTSLKLTKSKFYIFILTKTSLKISFFNLTLYKFIPTLDKDLNIVFHSFSSHLGGCVHVLESTATTCDIFPQTPPFLDSHLTGGNPSCLTKPNQTKDF